MTLFEYLNKRKGEYLLLLLSVWAVSVVAMNGFYLDDLLAQYGYLTRALIALPVNALLLLVLYAASFNAKRRVAGVFMYLLAAAVTVGVGIALSTGADIYTDAEGNYLYLALELVLVSAVGYLLTRTLPGSMAWFVVSAFTCSLAQAFFTGEDLTMSLLAAVSGLSLVVYRNFKLGVQGALVARKGSGALAFATALLPSLAAAGIALAAWFLVIAPLSPGVLDIKLFTEYRQLPIEEYVGTAQVNPLLNYDMTSKTTVDGEEYTTDDLKEDKTSDIAVDAASALQQQALVDATGSGTGSSSGGGSKQDFSEESQEQVYNPISYDSEFPWVTVWLVVVLLILLLIVAYFVIRKRLRMVRLRKMLQLEPIDQVKQLYRFILTRLERIGFKQPEGMSLHEFAASSVHQMDMLTEETKVPFIALTEVYVAADYGGIEPSEDDIVLFTAYYLRFWKAARAQMGNLKYFFTAFRL